MRRDDDLLRILRATLGALDARRGAVDLPRTFEPLFKSLGYETLALYLADDYPDRMSMVFGYGDEDVFPERVEMGVHASLAEALRECVGPVPGIMMAGLASRGRELGALAVTTREVASPETRRIFDVLVDAMSIVSLVERLGINLRRERQEREVFFAQSLTNRLLVVRLPELPGLRLGYKLIRSLEAGGDFFDFMPSKNGGLHGFIGCCNGKGLRTVMEVTSILRATHRAFSLTDSLSEALGLVNNLLVHEYKRAHQASLCLFEINARNGTLRLAKAGSMGIYMCCPGRSIGTVSAGGSVFLGMLPKPRIKEEEYEFAPGSALFCVTDGLYASRNFFDPDPGIRRLVEALEETAKAKRDMPLASAVFERLAERGDRLARPQESTLAISVEHVGVGENDGFRRRKATAN